MDTTLILFSGLAGTGKTTLARATARSLRVPLLGADHLMDYVLPRRMATYVTSADEILEMMFNLADSYLGLDVSVILDAVFMAGSRVTARELAARYNAEFRAIHTYVSDDAIWRQRVTQQTTSPAQPDQYPASWEAVQQEKTQYQPWGQHEALFVDAVAPIGENLARVLAYVEQPPPPPTKS
jgi:predicted kinase